MQRLEYLYDKYVTDTINESEKQELFELIAQADDSALKGLATKYLDREVPTDLRYLQEHTDNLWIEINQRIANPKMGSRKIQTWIPITIAAALLTMLSVGVYFWRNTHPTEISLTSQYGGDALPGGNRATLTLADGRSIELSAGKEGIIAAAGTLTYEDGEPLTQAIPDVDYATLSTPRGGQYRITLPDGTSVWLNAESSLKYPVAFRNNERRVLLSGEGLFEVDKNPEKPFIVESNGQTLRVTGTTFNINGYADSAIVTTLASGSVSLTDHSGRSTPLKPGQQSILLETGFTLRNVDPADYTSWKDGLIVLNEATFSEVAREIERWYDVSFMIPENLDSGRAYILLNRNEKLSVLLHSLEIAYEIHFTVNGKEVTVRK